jgi:hypothetical protein
MSAFSRGTLFRHQCLFFHPPSHSQLLRSFTTSSLLNAAKQNSGLAKKAFRSGNKIPKSSKTLLEQTVQVPSRTVPIASRSSTGATSGTAASTYNSYQELLAKKSHPTLLYQAPSHTLFLISSYSASLFCFGYAIWVSIAFTKCFYLCELGPPNMIVHYANTLKECQCIRSERRSWLGHMGTYGICCDLYRYGDVWIISLAKS